MASRGIGLDEGTATIKVVEVEKKGGALVPVRAVAVPSSVDDGGSPAYDSAALKAALAEAGCKSKSVVLGLTGKDLVIKYQQVPPVPDFQLRKIIDFELEEIRKQSGDDLAADFNVVPMSADLTSDDIVMLALSREQRVNERATRVLAAGLKAHHFTPNAIALFHAFRVFGPATSGDVLLVSIGRATTDFAVVRDGDLLYARSVNSGGDVLTDALAEQFNVSKQKAESLKRELGDLKPRDRRQGLSAQQEKVSYALEGAAGRLFSMVQATIALAKSQMQLNQLNVAKVFLTGGTAAMKGLDEYLAASLGIPVARFDPLGDAGVVPQGPAGSLEMTVALGLAVMAAETDAWSVEVIGASERKRREFAQKHVFTLAAIVVVAVYLGLAFVRWKEDHAVASAANERLANEQKRRNKSYARLAELHTARSDLAGKVDFLEKKKAAGDGMLRSLDLLVTELPEDLWVTKLELDFQETPGTKEKVAKRPVIRVHGSGKSLGARSVDSAYSAFIQAMQALPADAEDRPSDKLETQNPGRQKFEYDLELFWLAGTQKSETEEPPADAAPPKDAAKKTEKKTGAG